MPYKDPIVKALYAWSYNKSRRKTMGLRERGNNESVPRTPEYASWIAMKQRCRDKNQTHWPQYGGRGISVCDRWILSYSAFLADMGRKPTPTHTLDRVDVNGNYEPGNCRWATRKEQGNNRRPRGS